MKAALAAAAALVLLALIWLYSPRGDGVPAADGSSIGDAATASQGELAGFKSDAWFLPDDELLGFVEVPAGSFLIGSEAGDTLAFDNERWVEGADGSEGASGAAGARQAVDVPAFYIGRYEVTVAQFRAFVEATDRPVGAETLQAPGNHPVTSVTWADALAYARWLEGKLKEWEGTPAALKQMLADGGRVTLPSEIEWEKAARGTDGRVYPWGNELRTERSELPGDPHRAGGKHSLRGLCVRSIGHERQRLGVDADPVRGSTARCRRSASRPRRGRALGDARRVVRRSRAFRAGGAARRGRPGRAQAVHRVQGGDFEGVTDGAPTSVVRTPSRRPFSARSDYRSPFAGRPAPSPPLIGISTPTARGRRVVPASLRPFVTQFSGETPLMNQHGKLNYVEFHARDLEATKRFFTSAFGWSFTDYGPGYTAFGNEGLEGGFSRGEKRSSAADGAALLIFYSSNLEETQAKVEKAGGKIVQPIFAFPGGRRFHFTEPSGNELGVWSDK